MGETLTSTAAPAAAAAADSRILRKSVLPAVLLLTGIVVTFTPTLHENLRANEITAGVSMLALAVAVLVRHIRGRGAKTISAAVAAVISVSGGVSALVGEHNGALPLWLNLTITSALLVLLQLPWVLRGSSYFLLLAAAALAIAELLAAKDPVAAIGWFGAITVVGGVFSAIEVADELFGAGRKTKK